MVETSKHITYAKRVSQDEVHIMCRYCDFKQAVPLLINGEYDGKGIVINAGDGVDLHPVRKILRENIIHE